MMTEQIVEWIIAILPSCIAIGTVIATIVKVFKEFRELVKSFGDVKSKVEDMKCIDELKAQITQVVDENYELKKTIKELLTKIDHIQR